MRKRMKDRWNRWTVVMAGFAVVAALLAPLAYAAVVNAEEPAIQSAELPTANAIAEDNSPGSCVATVAVANTPVASAKSESVASVVGVVYSSSGANLIGTATGVEAETCGQVQRGSVDDEWRTNPPTS